MGRHSQPHPLVTRPHAQSHRDATVPQLHVPEGTERSRRLGRWELGVPQNQKGSLGSKHSEPAGFPPIPALHARAHASTLTRGLPTH